MNDFLFRDYGIIIVITLLLIVSISCGVAISNRTNRKKIRADIDHGKINETARQKCVLWLRYALLWHIVEYACVIIPFEINIIVLLLSFQTVIEPIIITIYSIVSLCFGIAYYSIRPDSHARAYRRAYTCLNKAIMIVSISDETLIDAIVKGESEIDHIYDL